MKKRIILFGGNSMVAKSIIKILENHKNYKVYLLKKGDELKNLPNKRYFLGIFLAQSEDYKNEFLTENLFYVNNILLRNTLEWSVGKVDYFLNFSSGSVYKKNKSGKFNSKSPLDWQSESPYVISKLMAELTANSFKNHFKRLINVRPFFIYGFNQKNTFLIKKIINNLKNNQKIFLDSSHGLIFNPIFSDDCAKIILNEIFSDSLFDKWEDNINISGSETISLKLIILHLIEKNKLSKDLINLKPLVKPKIFLNLDHSLSLSKESNWQINIEKIYDEE